MDIVLASQKHDLRLALEMLFREEPGAAVVGTASESEGLLALIHSTRPNLVLLDWDLPGQPPAEVLAEIKSAARAPKIFILGRDADVEEAALAAGADVFVLIGDPPGQLLAASRQVSAQL
jgi:DNA-binding NarL/FixJ family response regulator